MHPRQSIVELFSTFVQFNADRFRSWAMDAKLRRSMQNCLKSSNEETSENFWVLYWHNYLPNPQSGKLAREHLIAYLQESCYWMSQKTVANFVSTQYTLSDCFQIAIASVDKILKNFDPNQGFLLKNYAGVIFGTVIRENLRQRHEVDICTDWGMLRKISQKRLLESLQAAGLSPDTINAYSLAWNCFKTLYVPTQVNLTRQLSRPDDKIWEAIAKAYNSQTSQQVNSQTLENWLLTSAACARKYLYPTTTSINISGFGKDSNEWVDNLATEMESILTEIINEEEEQTRTSQQAEINQVLITAVSQLEVQAQQMLQLWYGEGLTQQQIAKQLDIQQYTVSRRFTKIRESLLRTLANWSQDKLHISLTSDILKSMNMVMEEWLQTYYSLSPQSKIKPKISPE